MNPTDTQRLDAMLKHGWIVEEWPNHWDGQKHVDGFMVSYPPNGYMEGGGRSPELGFGLTQRAAIDAAMAALPK